VAESNVPPQVTSLNSGPGVGPYTSEVGNDVFATWVTAVTANVTPAGLTETGWYDASGFENGDECAYIFGSTRGAPGGFYNQVINGGRFLTQQEFSNKVFNASGGTAGCVPSQSAE